MSSEKWLDKELAKVLAKWRAGMTDIGVSQDELDAAISALASLSGPKPESAEAVHAAAKYAWERGAWAWEDVERGLEQFTAPSAPVGVEGLAGKIGVHYAQHESCKPGVPFYAFTADELRRFAAALTQQPAAVAPVGVDVWECLAALASFINPNDPDVSFAELSWRDRAHRLIAQQPAAVDEAMVGRFCRRWYEITGRSLERVHVLASLDSALAGQQQGTPGGDR